MPFGHEGRFYRFAMVHSDTRPIEQPHPPLFFGNPPENPSC
jgi:alkanesulfonate monooxygenase SsuD/methylene tetrahydromethanopterin reductase-like flavin-dependent oxidoreductase (luciferase family)